MWAWGPDQSVRFWSRRQLHETAIHRIDLAQASAAPAQLEPEIARDSILELLDFLPSAAVFLPEVVQLRGNGETIAIRATDLDDVGTITLTPHGFTFAPTVADAHTDASVAGSINDLALVIARRLDADQPGVVLSGRSELVAHWIGHSALR